MGERYDQALDAIYASVTAPERWHDALGALCGLFGCHFGDAFARTVDFRTYRGVAHGLDEDDYQHGMLDGWVKRNVWSTVHPVREAGHIVTTREMVTPAALRRSEMYADYLHPRDLHEGLRFDLWVGDGWVQDISLIRAWSAGPFDDAELAMARRLLPHLQRAAAVARRLQEAESMAVAGFEAMDGLRQPVFLTDVDARVLRANAAAERLLATSDTALTSMGTALSGPTEAATAQLRAVVAGAARFGRQSGRMRLHGPGGALDVVALPVSTDTGWTSLRGPAVLVMASGPRPDDAGPSAAHLAALFELTAAEAEVARLLARGCAVADIAGQLHRSVNTVRTHVARLMTKTGTHRQAALVRLLLHAPPEDATRGGPRFG